MKISYAITVCNELKEITELTNFLQSRIEEEDEIIIQYDTNGVTKEVSDFLTIFGEINKQTKIVSFPLNKDFASFKNNLKKNCNGDYMSTHCPNKRAPLTPLKTNVSRIQLYNVNDEKHQVDVFGLL